MTLISAAGTLRDGSTGDADASSGCSFAATSEAFAARMGTIFDARGGGIRRRACASACSKVAIDAVRPLTSSAPLDESSSTVGSGRSCSEPLASCA